MNALLRTLPAALLIAASGTLFSDALIAQDAASQQRLEDAAALHANTGLAQMDGDWIGGGAGYEALFEKDKVRFVPALPTSPVLPELVWTTSGIARGQGATYRLPAAEPIGFDEGETLRVEYQRGAVTETYELRLDGLKQNFVFDSLPSGEGDLVVRGRIDSVLPFREQSERGLRFGTEEIGSIRIGQVLGIDANGASIEGSIRFDGQQAELRLPGHLVEQAALPLILDPLLTPETELGDPATYEEEDSAVAYDASEDVYLAVWVRKFSSTVSRIRGQRLNGDGTLLGSTLFISFGNSGRDLLPDTANIAVRDAFGVVFLNGNEVLMRRVGTDGTISNPLTVASQADSRIRPAIGGESTLDDDDATVVWADFLLGIRAKSIQFQPNGTLLAFQTIDISGPADQPGYPSISKSGGFTGNHLIVWTDQAGNGFNSRVLGQVYDRNLNALTPVRVIEGVEDGDYPQCDGNGTNWIVVYESEPFLGSNDNDVIARSYMLSAAGTLNATSIAQEVEASPNQDEVSADIAWLGSTALVVWKEESSPGSDDFNVFFQPIDALNANRLGFGSVLGMSGGSCGYTKICSTFSGDPQDTSEHALFSWTETSPGISRVLSYVREINRDGLITPFGGGCGDTGTLNTGSATVGNPAFQVGLTGAKTNEIATLIASPTTLFASCGPCTLVPNPNTGFTLSLSTSTDGDVRVSLPIPNDPALQGARLLVQWAVTNQADPACTTFGLDLSEAIGIEIE